jgi:hypothetical protein
MAKVIAAILVGVAACGVILLALSTHSDLTFNPQPKVIGIPTPVTVRIANPHGIRRITATVEQEGNKCQGLAFAGNASPGPCPASGVHDHTGSANYFIPLEGSDVASAGFQLDWRWCNKCQGLASIVNALGPCPAGGAPRPTPAAATIT